MVKREFNARLLRHESTTPSQDPDVIPAKAGIHAFPAPFATSGPLNEKKSPCRGIPAGGDTDVGASPS